MTAPEKISVLIVDDNSSMRRVLRVIVDAEPGLQTVGEAANGRDAIVKVEVLSPDVVVMDIEMPRLGGIEATRVIKERWPHTIVIGCTALEDERVRRAMREAGASAHILKSKALTLLAPMISSATRSRPRTIEVTDEDEQESDRGTSDGVKPDRVKSDRT